MSSYRHVAPQLKGDGVLQQAAQRSDKIFFGVVRIDAKIRLPELDRLLGKGFEVDETVMARTNFLDALKKSFVVEDILKDDVLLDGVIVGRDVDGRVFDKGLDFGAEDEMAGAFPRDRGV